MKRRRDKAASALLMVVGLLTILGMLGGTFLVVASMHRRVTTSLAAGAPLADMPAGIAKQVAGVLLDDLYIDEIATDNSAPYVAATGQDGVPKYADSPGTDDILDVEKVGNALFAGAAKGDHVDTDGDGIPDAYLFPTGIMNCRGQQIYAAVRVVDLSSLMCVNTGCDMIVGVSPVSPVMIGLKQLLGDAAYGSLHAERCGGTAKTVTEFNTDCALRLSDPVAGYELFGIEDELVLRWLKPLATTNTGRLYGVVSGFASRELLTTTARSRSILRNPKATRKARLLISSLAALDDEAARMWLHGELCKIVAGETLQEDEEVDIVIDNAQGSPTGSWVTSTYAPDYSGINYAHDNNADKGAKSFKFTPSIPVGGEYTVSMWWPHNPAYADPNVPVDITYSGGTASISVNQFATGSAWISLGTYTFITGTSGNVTIHTTGTTNYVMADAVRFYKPAGQGEGEPPPIPDPIIIDNNDAGTSPNGSWTTSTWAPDYNGTNYLHDDNAGKGTKSFTFTPSIPVPGQYEVSMWWPNNPDYADANVPVDITHAGGTANISVNQFASGSAWISLGTYTLGAGTGTVTIRTTGTTNYVMADAVKFVCTSVAEAADTTVVDHFVANLWAYLSQLDPKTEPFKVNDVYGVLPQLVITEAYAYSFADDTGTPEDDSGWAYAIELMNPTAHSVDASNYFIQLGTATSNFSAASPAVGAVASGQRFVLYAFGGVTLENKTTAGDKNYFFGSKIGSWHEVTAANVLDFAQANTAGGAIRIMRAVGDENIPVDSVSGADIGYTITKTGGVLGGDVAMPAVSFGRRDDNFDRGRALVAKMKVTALEHATRENQTLGSANGLTADDTDLAGVYQGFFINKATAATGLPTTLGESIARYITGPTVAETSDLPHKLVEHMANATRGKIDYNCATEAWPSDYPALPWPTILGELLELVPPHTAASLIYGRININTAPKEVLEHLPFPIIQVPGSTTGTIADAIIAGRPYYSPGQLGQVLGNYATGKLDQAAADYLENRDSLYNAISNLITVNSDTFAAYIRTQLGSDPNAGAHYHVAVIDRSNCTGPDDEPKILMLAEVK